MKPVSSLRADGVEAYRQDFAVCLVGAWASFGYPMRWRWINQKPWQQHLVFVHNLNATLIYLYPFDVTELQSIAFLSCESLPAGEFWSEKRRLAPHSLDAPPAPTSRA